MRERLWPYISWNRIKTTFAKNPLCSAVVVREKRVAAHLARCNKSRSQSAFCRSTIIIVCRPVSQALDQSPDCYAAFLYIHSFRLSLSFIHFHFVIPLRWLYYSLLRFISVLVRFFFIIVNEVIFVGIVCAGCSVEAFYVRAKGTYTASYERDPRNSAYGISVDTYCVYMFVN